MAKKRYRQSKKIKMRGITERILVGSLILLCVILVGFSLFMIIKSVGKMNLHRHADRVASSELTQNLSEAAKRAVQMHKTVRRQHSLPLNYRKVRFSITERYGSTTMIL